jgi:hypothetical protein
MTPNSTLNEKQLLENDPFPQSRFLAAKAAWNNNHKGKAVGTTKVVSFPNHFSKQQLFTIKP